MPSESSSPASILPAVPETLGEVLSLAFNSLPPESRDARTNSLLTDAVEGRLPFEGIWEARRGDRLVAALFSQVQPGRTAVVWPPQAVVDEPRETLDRLMSTMHDWMLSREVRLCYAMFEQLDGEDRVVLEQAGYRYLVDLLYLVCQETDFPRIEPSGSLELECYRPEGHDRLTRVMNATYEGTLDCPAMNGLRTAEDILDGYRATGVYRSDLWSILRHQGQDVGCLILADHPEHENCELVYMGVVAGVRGQNLGMQVTEAAKWQARRLGRTRLVLAVDEENLPARALYAAAQFTQWDRKTVHMRDLTRP